MKNPDQYNTEMKSYTFFTGVAVILLLCILVMVVSMLLKLIF